MGEVSLFDVILYSLAGISVLIACFGGFVAWVMKVVRDSEMRGMSNVG